MPNRQLSGAIARAAVHPRADSTDAQLLEGFARDRDGAAFTELVRRHGPMVLGVCRRTLGDTPDAEDAFQAVWLVLVRKAASIAPAGMVGNWLYGVATRTAVHVRGKRFQMGARQRELPDLADPRPDPAEANELAAAFDTELDQLPTKFRAAFVLCELEGRSLKDAATELGVPMGTVASRLARGRAMLADRLRSRGFAASVLTALLAGATAPVSARQCETATTLATAPREVAGTVTEFAQGVLRGMLAHKLRTATRAAMVLALLAGAVGLAAWNATAQPEPPPPVQAGDPYAGLLVPRGKAELKAEEDRLWAALLSDEPEASRAVLRFASMPQTALKIFQERLVPLRADKEKIRKLIADLDSDKEPVWKGAMESLSYLDPLLAFGPEEVLAEAITPVGKQRLAAVLTQSDPMMFANGSISIRNIGDNRFNFVVSDLRRGVRTQESMFGLEHDINAIRRPTWIRAARAVAILESLGTPDALELLKEMATGHPDALPTVTAKGAVATLTAPAP
jgi:RNA polymerase sigma factor (sigma-70 family)